VRTDLQFLQQPLPLLADLIVSSADLMGADLTGWHGKSNLGLDVARVASHVGSVWAVHQAKIANAVNTMGVSPNTTQPTRTIHSVPIGCILQRWIIIIQPRD
jgi:hypothetical protein